MHNVVCLSCEVGYGDAISLARHHDNHVTILTLGGGIPNHLILHLAQGGQECTSQSQQIVHHDGFVGLYLQHH